MEYELAKKLKDLGFPQELENGDWGYCIDCGHGDEIHLAHEDNDEGNFVGNDYQHRLGEKHQEYGHNILVKLPTLEELIKACGDKFAGLNRVPNIETGVTWVAIANNGGFHVGETLSEAVANLWLALQK